ncbi:hypothetical protein [Carboxylicivirga taeanensis]|uniref:hypothetical protein n=1 Tax=Carboxylicivirga taeanensis TaxID=1416875 RepID=UPI003F6DD66C
METYINQLIETIEEAIDKAPGKTGFEEDEDEHLFAQEFLQGRPEKISKIVGIEKYNFPLANQLSSEQISKLLEATEKLLKAYNWEFMFPENVKPSTKYQFIIDLWDSKHVYCQQGVVQIETCQFDENHCPFPGQCQVCHSFKCNDDDSHHCCKGQVDFSNLTPDIDHTEDAELRGEIERFKALMQQPQNDNFIVGIHNYCDGRCNRCEFTQQCSSYALNKELDFDFTDDDGSSQKQLAVIFQATTEIIQEELSKKGINAQQAMEALADEDKIQTPKHSLELLAESYAEKVTRWLESNQMELESRLVSEPTPAIQESFESITWFQLFIPAKVSRAVSSASSKQPSECEVYDARGSAKVALLAIDECMQAWELILKSIPKKEDSVLNLLRHLSKIKDELEGLIPEARSFIRPGFDE